MQWSKMERRNGCWAKYFRRCGPLCQRQNEQTSRNAWDDFRGTVSVNEWSKNLKDTLALGFTSNNHVKEKIKAAHVLRRYQPIISVRVLKTATETTRQCANTCEQKWATELAAMHSAVHRTSADRTYQYPANAPGISMWTDHKLHSECSLSPRETENMQLNEKYLTVYSVEHWELSDRWCNVLRKVS